MLKLEVSLFLRNRHSEFLYLGVGPLMELDSIPYSVAHNSYFWGIGTPLVQKLGAIMSRFSFDGGNSFMDHAVERKRVALPVATTQSSSISKEGRTEAKGALLK